MSLHQNGYLTFDYSEKDFYFASTHEKIYPKKAEEAKKQEQYYRLGKKYY